MVLSGNPGISIDISNLNFEILKKYYMIPSLRDFAYATTYLSIPRCRLDSLGFSSITFAGDYNE